MTPLRRSRPSPARTVRVRSMGGRIADRVRALTSRRRAAPTGEEPWPLRVEILPRGHGRLREFLICEKEADTVSIGIDTGKLRASLRLGENYGINAHTGELTAWIPEPEEVDDWPATFEPEVVDTPELIDLTMECGKLTRIPKALMDPPEGQGTDSPVNSRPRSPTEAEEAETGAPERRTAWKKDRLGG